MLRILSVLSLLMQTQAFRTAQRKSSSFTTRTDENTGMCAGHIRKDTLPITLPLLCTGAVTNLKFKARAFGQASPRLRLYIDGEGKGYRTFPVFGGTRTWEVSHSSLSAGIHNIRYTGDRLEMRWVEVSGTGGSCSFDTAPGYAPNDFTNSGLDVITRVLGPAQNNFSSFYKKQLHFAHETYGRSADDSISSTAISNGIWEWFYMYSQEQDAKDEWLVRKTRDGRMYEESDILPYLEVSLDQLPGRIGDEMVVCEPCNTLSNIVFHEAAVFTGCKGLPFTRDETATLMAGLSGLAAGSGFFHASATSTGQLADRFTMEIIMYQVHQLMVKPALTHTGSSLTSEERDIIMYLGKDAGESTDMARELTTLFRGQYNRTEWNTRIRTIDGQYPSYTFCIVTTIVTFVESLRGNWPLPGLETAINALMDALLPSLGGSDVEFVLNTFRPAIRKAFDNADFCGDRFVLIGRFLNFVITFVEAFVFQEELISVPDVVRDIVGFLDNLGLASGSLADMKQFWDLYNTQTNFCHDRSPHGLWHEKAAHGLLHIQNVASLLTTDVKRSCR